MTFNNSNVNSSLMLVAEWSLQSTNAFGFSTFTDVFRYTEFNVDICTFS